MTCFRNIQINPPQIDPPVSFINSIGVGKVHS